MRGARLALLVVLGCTPVNRRLDPGPFDLEAAGAASGVSAEARGWLLRARVAEERGEIEEAERAWAWVLRLERTEPASWVAWGRYLERAQRTPEAQQAYETALDHDPTWAPAHLYLGDLLVRGGHDAAASGHLERAVRGGESAAWGVLARLYERTEDTDALDDLVGRWLDSDVRDPDQRLLRAQAAIAAGRPADGVEDLVVVLGERDDPLVGELLAEASIRGCRLGTAWEATQRLGLADDARHARAVDRLARAVAAPGVVPRSEGEVVDMALRMIDEGRVDQARDLLAEGRAHGFGQRLWLVQALSLAVEGRTGPALDALERVTESTVVPQVDRRFTDVDEASLTAQAAELAGHVLLEADESVEAPTPGVALRMRVRDGAEIEAGSARLRTALYLDAGRVDEAVSSATTDAARAVLAPVRPDLVRADPPACDGPTLVALAAHRSPCQALEWLHAAWEAAPLLAGLDLSVARDACDAAPSPE